MSPLAATRTADRPAPPRAPALRLAMVEDLNWPRPVPPAKKPTRPEIWAPGLGEVGEADRPTLQ